MIDGDAATFWESSGAAAVDAELYFLLSSAASAQCVVLTQNALAAHACTAWSLEAQPTLGAAWASMASWSDVAAVAELAVGRAAVREDRFKGSSSEVDTENTSNCRGCKPEKGLPEKARPLQVVSAGLSEGTATPRTV